MLEVDILVHRSLDDAVTQPITLRLTRKPVSLRTALELVLERLEAEPTSYVIRDGIIVVTDQTQTFELAVYDCRKLLAGLKNAESPAGLTNAVEPPGEKLIDVVTQSVLPITWARVGGTASISEIDGLLVVKHSQQAHREVARLIEQLNAAAGK